VTPARSRLRLGLLVVSALAAAALAALVPGASAHSGHPVAGSADTTGPGLVLRRVGSFSFPVYVTSPPGDNSRQFVVEQDGRIKLIKDGRVLARPFLDVSSLIDFQGERGLLSMAFPPDYEATRRFYIFYTARDGDLTVDELRRSASNPDVANRNTRRRVIEIPTRSSATTTAASSRWVERAALHLDRGRRRRQRPAGPRPERQHAARQGPPHRPAPEREQALHDPVEQSLRRPRRGRSHLGVWAAQPVALLLRPRHRRHGDRRRGPA
jgi:hypothetical protein